MWSKYVVDGYIVAVGPGNVGEIIGEEEYLDIVAALETKPPFEEGYGVRLREDLTWEKFPYDYKDGDEDDL